MAVLLVACCVLIPVVSSFLVEPYIVSVFGTVGQGVSSDNLWIGSICVIIVVVVLFAGLGKQRGRKVGVYLAGVGRDNENRMFQNSMSGTTEATARNWYMVDVFGEARRTCRRLVQHHHHGCGFRVRDRRHADGFLAGEWINDDFAFPLLGTIAFAIVGPALGCLLAGLDRIISARMQGRVGPPLLQPYYDVRKLLGKRACLGQLERVRLRRLRAALRAFGGGIFLQRRKPAALRVRHHAFEFVLHHRGVFVSIPVRRDRRGSRDAAGHGLRADGASFRRGVFHGAPGLSTSRRFWSARCR